jgi:hypothetical protein
LSDYVKLHTDALDNPKIQALPDDLVRPWMNLIMIARLNGGFLPSLPILAFRLRVDQVTAAGWLSRLRKATLIDAVGDRGDLQPHDWEEWNPPAPSDRTNAERQKRWRLKRKNPPSPTPLTPEKNNSMNECVTPLRNETVTPLRNETVTPLRNGVTVFPVTATTIREPFPNTDDAMVQQIIDCGQRAWADIAPLGSPPLADAQLAEYVKAAHFHKQWDAGAYRKGVAQVVRSRMAPKPPTEPTAGMKLAQQDRENSVRAAKRREEWEKSQNETKT